MTFRHELDCASSELVVRTRAKGLLSRFAHDLQIGSHDFDATLEMHDASWSADLSVPVSSLRVVGAMRHGKVDRTALSTRDTQEIERRICLDVLPVKQVHVHLHGDCRQSGSAEVKVGAGRQQVDFRVLTDGTSPGSFNSSGTLQLSLKALGIKEIRAPLGAFVVADAVDLIFTLSWLASADQS